MFVYVLGSWVNQLFLQNIVCGFMTLAYTAFFMFLPENPVFLIRKTKIGKAEKSMRVLRGVAYDASVEIVKFKNISKLQALKKTVFARLSRNAKT